MTLVLAFSVQGIADALRIKRKSLNTKPGDRWMTLVRWFKLSAYNSL